MEIVFQEALAERAWSMTTPRALMRSAEYAQLSPEAGRFLMECLVPTDEQRRDDNDDGDE